jgi:hypothetical protein
LVQVGQTARWTVTLVMDWSSMENEHLTKLSFESFMKEFRECWLPHNWEQMICMQMLGTHLDMTKHRFKSWAMQVMSHNISLQNTPSFMTEDKLRTQLKIMLDVELQTLAHSQKISEITDLHKWMTEIKEMDNQHQINLKHMEQFFDAASMRAAKRQNTQPRTSTSSTATSTTYPPRLTDEE